MYIFVSQGFSIYYGHGIRVISLPTDEILENILSSKKALMYYWDSVDKIFSINKTDPASSVLLCETIHTFWIKKDKPSGMVLPKGSPFKEIFNIK